MTYTSPERREVKSPVFAPNIDKIIINNNMELKTTNHRNMRCLEQELLDIIRSDND